MASLGSESTRRIRMNDGIKQEKNMAGVSRRDVPHNVSNRRWAVQEARSVSERGCPKMAGRACTEEEGLIICYQVALAVLQSCHP
jgi:hypothetical protein